MSGFQQMRETGGPSQRPYVIACLLQGQRGKYRLDITLLGPACYRPPEIVRISRGEVAEVGKQEVAKGGDVT